MIFRDKEKLRIQPKSNMPNINKISLVLNIDYFFLLQNKLLNFARSRLYETV